MLSVKKTGKFCWGKLQPLGGRFDLDLLPPNIQKNVWRDWGQQWRIWGSPLIPRIFTDHERWLFVVLYIPINPKSVNRNQYGILTAPGVPSSTWSTRERTLNNKVKENQCLAYHVGHTVFCNLGPPISHQETHWLDWEPTVWESRI